MSCYDHIGRRTERFGSYMVIKYINGGVNGRDGVDGSQIISFPLIHFNLNLHLTRWHQAVLAAKLWPEVTYEGRARFHHRQVPAVALPTEPA